MTIRPCAPASGGSTPTGTAWAFNEQQLQRALIVYCAGLKRGDATVDARQQMVEILSFLKSGAARKLRITQAAHPSTQMSSREPSHAPR